MDKDPAKKWNYDIVPRAGQYLFVIIKDDVVRGSLTLKNQEEIDQWIATLANLNTLPSTQ
jgi:hypothetical protein